MPRAESAPAVARPTAARPNGTGATSRRLPPVPPPAHEDPGTPGPSSRGGISRILLLVAGASCTALAAVGAFLPVLPTTPFLILAAACFARSSPAFHAKLMESPVFGPYLRQWRADRTVPAEAKRKAYGLVLVTFGISIAVVDVAWLRILLAVLAVCLVIFLRKLPVTRS